MTSIITSDIHLGCAYCDANRFLNFLQSLPSDAELVLGGDVLDQPQKVLRDVHLAAWNCLVATAARQPVTWVRGNHDKGCEAVDTGKIDVVDRYSVGQRLLVLHGHHFDNVVHHDRWFVWAMAVVRTVRALLRAETSHVARHAKRFPPLYAVLRNYVARNAVQHARENGYKAIVCGHTHYAEEREIEGIRYFNTGAWTETLPHCLRVNTNEVQIEPAA